MRVHVHANCQAVPIVGMLGEVCPEWDVTSFEVHTDKIMSNTLEYQNSIRSADVILSQPIHNGFRGCKELSIDWIRSNSRPQATIIMFPSMHFTGHHPGLDGLPLPGLPYLSNVLAAHLVACGIRTGDALSYMLSDDLLSETEIEMEMDLSIDEMKRREIDDAIDIKLSSFLEANCRERVLFHIHNHPTRETTAFVANGILERLGETRRISAAGHDYQKDTNVPPLPTIAQFIRTRCRTPGGASLDDNVLLHGYQPMTQREYYTEMIERLWMLRTDEIIGAVERCWPTIEVLRRLAASKSSIPGIARWSPT